MVGRYTNFLLTVIAIATMVIAVKAVVDLNGPQPCGYSYACSIDGTVHVENKVKVEVTNSR